MTLDQMTGLLASVVNRIAGWSVVRLSTLYEVPWVEEFGSSRLLKNHCSGARGSRRLR
jgi:hypothetical protein